MLYMSFSSHQANTADKWIEITPTAATAGSTEKAWDSGRACGFLLNMENLVRFLFHDLGFTMI